MAAFGKFVVGEWYFALPMLGLSFVAFTLVFWRLLLNLDFATSPGRFLPLLEEELSLGGVDRALRFCRSRQDVLPRKLCTAGLEAAGEGPGAMRRAMAEVIQREILPAMNFLLPPILAIAKIATMIGLLGTVLSMIHTFTLISEADSTAHTVTAGAIGLALFATALGLIIAVPLVFAHVLLKANVRRFELRLRYTAERLIDMVCRSPHEEEEAWVDGGSKAILPSTGIGKPLVPPTEATIEDQEANRLSPPPA